METTGQPSRASSPADPLLNDPDLIRHTYIVIDFEALTPAGRPAVPVEVAALALTVKDGDLAELWRYQALMAPPPEVPVTAFDARQTGLTREQLTDAKQPSDIMAELDAHLNAPPYRLVAQHAPTEAGLIARQRPHCPALAVTPLLDTVRLARVLYPELTSHSLDALLCFLRIPRPIDRHRAMPDVEATAEVFRRLLADGQKAGWRTLHRLEVVAGLAPKKLRAPEGDQEELF
ncbi:3'-5' exonuclease [Nonomuraea sp. SYSU D8015]|uniref:3'-5' exonuclease n=1 Tax=Nonomuraea sp. SYSU D8015 TaxID=2593644 RepID=UPI001661085C|nr:3'-5' exonuclease [Nonomuraea sp. SYSU D8015]